MSTEPILEGIVTTVNADGTANVSPMGPVVDDGHGAIRLRLYQSSVTFQNLRRTGEGVFHVTDDVELLARAAVDRLERLPDLLPAAAVRGNILADACRWYAFRVDELDDRQARAELVGRIVDRGRLRDFFGFNRAKHAVVEAAILASRVALLPAAEIRAEMKRLAVPVEKTAGAQERRAFQFLQEYVDAALADRDIKE